MVSNNQAKKEMMKVLIVQLKTRPKPPILILPPIKEHTSKKWVQTKKSLRISPKALRISLKK
jgi:hypothetical protein